MVDTEPDAPVFGAADPNPELHKCPGFLSKGDGPDVLVETVNDSGLDCMALAAALEEPSYWDTKVWAGASLPDVEEPMTTYSLSALTCFPSRVIRIHVKPKAESFDPENDDAEPSSTDITESLKKNTQSDYSTSSCEATTKSDKDTEESRIPEEEIDTIDTTMTPSENSTDSIDSSTSSCETTAESDEDTAESRIPEEEIESIDITIKSSENTTDSSDSSTSSCETTAKKDHETWVGVTMLTVRLLTKCRALDVWSRQGLVTYTDHLVGRTLQGLTLNESFCPNYKESKQVCKAVIKDLAKTLGSVHTLESTILLGFPCVENTIIECLQAHIMEYSMSAHKKKKGGWRKRIWPILYAVAVCTIWTILFLIVV